jgi:signal peptidase I
MLPTFNTWGDFLLVKKILSHHNDQLKIGDLVIITSPYDASVVACKRVIAKVSLINYLLIILTH